MRKNYVIIVAGGTGSRMGSDTPKQFLLLKGIPVIMHTIRAFYQSNHSPQIIVSIHPSLSDDWKALCELHHFDIPHTLVNGGHSRFESVKNGLKAIKTMDLELARSIIAVHDAARPLISPTLIDETYRQAALTGAAVLALPATDSVRIVSGNGLENNAFPRESVYLVQTPQTFNGALLSDAYEHADDNYPFTDDASVVERKGHRITLVNGDARNIKITFPQDLYIAEILLGQGR